MKFHQDAPALLSSNMCTVHEEICLPNRPPVPSPRGHQSTSGPELKWLSYKGRVFVAVYHAFSSADKRKLELQLASYCTPRIRGYFRSREERAQRRGGAASADAVCQKFRLPETSLSQSAAAKSCTRSFSLSLVRRVFAEIRPLRRACKAACSLRPPISLVACVRVWPANATTETTLLPPFSQPSEGNF